MHHRAQSRPAWQRRFTAAELQLVNAEPRPAAELMAEVFIERARDGFDDTCHLDLVRAGFSEAEILQGFDKANALATETLRDVDVADDRTSYDRQARVMLGAVTIAGALDPNTVNSMLRNAGLATREIGNLFDDIVGEALRLMRETRADTVVL